MGDKKGQKDIAKESETAVSHPEGSTPAIQHLADHPEPAPTTISEISPEISPPIVETPAESRITTQAESADTAPVQIGRAHV